MFVDGNFLRGFQSQSCGITPSPNYVEKGDLVGIGNINRVMRAVRGESRCNEGFAFEVDWEVGSDSQFGLDQLYGYG